ncbi:MarR family transcriptional regulator [Clostridium putrefaciens]|uniref:MarR family transcriptional regulator n=1 Tax=Clostridium putrefaciens TaxID=99675 RepID=A0A381JAX1_9CLOT|nr:LysR family transcriptional regulator [Clostridium putrefaciens]SUY47586.1 MarR family transcriptional regulator [Clostridium putrefaciens]
MTIRHLRIFIEVADSGKMSIAASNLFLSQPTVSQTIKELEQHYGVLLFERFCKKLYITEQGKRLLSYARYVVNQFDDLEENMIQSKHVEKIRIGTTVTIGNCILSNILSSFNESNPEVETYAYVNNTKIIEEKLLNSELDIGIVEGEIKSSDLVCIPEVEDYLVLVCSTKHPFASRKEIKLNELSGVGFAMREKGSGTRELFEDYMLKNGVTIKTKWESNCPGAIKRAVLENQHLAAISVRLVEEEIKDGEIHVIQNSECAWNRHFSIVYHKNKFINKSMEDLIEVVKNYKHMDILEEVKTGWLVK